MKIFINPGHGGSDPGAVGNGLREADVALNIGNRAADYLRAVGYDVKVFQYDGLNEICADSNAWGADLFVSIHCNAASPAAKGTETYCYYGATAGRKLATAINKQITSSLPIVDRGVKEADFAVLRGTDAVAVLVETAFITNADDARLLVEREDDFARAIARGVTDYFTISYPNLSTQKPIPDVIDMPVDAQNHSQPYKTSSELFSEHFAKSEFTCHCCGRGANKIHPRLIELLEELRAKAGVPLHINCGYRCPAHNAEVGGVPNSQHVLGTAADITIPAISFSKAQQLVRSIDFDGKGWYPPVDSSGLWFIHVDVRDGGVGADIEWEG